MYISGYQLGLKTCSVIVAFWKCTLVYTSTVTMLGRKKIYFQRRGVLENPPRFKKIFQTKKDSGQWDFNDPTVGT